MLGGPTCRHRLGAGLGLSPVGLFEAIRRDARREGLSVRALARRYRVHRRTVRQALASPVPPARKPRLSVAPKLDPVRPLIDAMLREDLAAPRKQCHTTRRVLARLVDEHGVRDLSYSTVRDYVPERRVEINAEAGRCVGEAFVPQTHDPGEEAAVDFADLWIDLKGCARRFFCSRCCCRSPAGRFTARSPRRRIANRTATVGRGFAAEAVLLRPLPVEPFEPGLALTPRVDRYAQVTVRTCCYSVPVRLIGRQVRALLRASELHIFDSPAQIARHPRSVVKGGQVLLLDHYLEVLVRKQARRAGRVDGAGAGPQDRDVHRRG
jgi:hypothetical protein